MIAITIDVEPDPPSGGYKSIAVLEKFLTGINKPLTLLITPDIFEKFPDLIESWSKVHEIGLHIHPMYLGYENDHFNRYPKEKQREIIERGLDVASKTFNTKKLKSFRIGRWCFSKYLPSILEDFGFTHDSSIYPSGVSDNRPWKIGDITEISPTIWVPRAIKVLHKLRGVTRDDSWEKGGINYESSSLDIFHLPFPFHFIKRGGFVFTEGLLGGIDGRGIYFATKRLRKTKYLVFAFHPFNLLNLDLKEKIERYIKYCTNKRESIKLSEITEVR